ncbi:MAG: hypothetical protein K8S25_16055 [Alphaproteobacteria bacterium]|nr:hypothetical protein [Alphaproteobacteria bacterium]
MASVTIVEEGRDGRVEYRDGLRTISGYWAFGGADVVTIVSMGSREEWQRSHGWAVVQRANILRFVADEVIRLRAPSCTAEIDEQSGEILVRQGRDAVSRAKVSASSSRQAKAVAFVHNYSDFRAKFAVGVLIAVLIGGGLFWLGQQAVTVTAVSGVPLRESLRFDSDDPARPGGVATLIETTDPYPLDISGRGGNRTGSLSILVTPLDGSKPQLIPFARRISSGAYSLARIMGSDGRTLWFDAAGLYGVRLGDYALITTNDLRAANPGLDASWWEDSRGMDLVEGKLHVMRIDRSAAMDIDPDTLTATGVAPKPSNARFERREPADYLAAGLVALPGEWIGLHAPAELSGEFRPGRWIKVVENADDVKVLRRLCKGSLGAATADARFRIRSIAPIGDAQFLEAAFLRIDDKSEPIRLTSPDSALMIHTSSPGLAGTLVVSRVDYQGQLLWSTDTGLDRFQLKQILPGQEVLAFVGTRPPVPDKLSEPFVVLVETGTGKMTSQSLWR